MTSYKTTVWGVFADRLGHGYWTDANGLIERCSTQPSLNYRHRQNVHVGIDVGHDDAEIGTAVYFERDTDDKLWAVGVIDGAPDFDSMPRLFWSPLATAWQAPDSLEELDVLLHTLSITASPATVALTPLQHLDGDVRHSSSLRSTWTNPPHLLRRASDYCAARRKSDPLTIEAPHEAPTPAAIQPSERRVPSTDVWTYPDRAPLGPAIHRPGRILSVGGRQPRFAMSAADYRDELMLRRRAGAL